VLGTTITLYCFFWQASQEAEDERVDPAAHTLLAAPEEALVVRALFWSAVINGVVAVPPMVISMLMAMRRDVMGRFVLPRALWATGWLCTVTMAAVVGIMFATW
jgi:Mn2+/Fe2+ NRAMP family transporter